MSARFARTLAMLLRAKIPMISVLEITADVMGNNVLFREAVITIKEQVMSGAALSKPLQMCGLFPPMFVHMISIGEETGSLEEILENMAGYYEEEVADQTERMTAVIEPMLILIMALIIGVLILAIMQPMLALYDAVRNM